MDPRLGRLLLGFAVLLAVGLLGYSVLQALARHEPPALPEPAADLWLPGPPAAVQIRQVIHSGDTLGGILAGYGLDAHAIRQAGLPHHDLASLRQGRALTLVAPSGSDDIAELRYPLGEDETLVLQRTGTGWSSLVEEVQYQATPIRSEFTVERTLWEAAIEAGLRPADILAVARVFESDVDFNTEIQRGDRVELVAEELVREDGFTKLGPPLAVRLASGDKVLTATRFQAPGADRAEYWDDDGVNRKGAFLRSPLEFSRVTSGFSTGRFHPVLKRKRPHYGVDFGAPTGTPVRAVAKGKVVRAGRAGGHGNFVKLDHDGPYETSYSHLSRIEVRAGEQVAQGQVIGRVGATGLATGPHLHYQLWVGGRYKDPLKTELPRNEQLPASALPAYHQRREQLRAILDGELDPSVLQPPPPVQDTGQAKPGAG